MTKIPDFKYTNHDLQLSVIGNNAQEIDTRARDIGEKYFGCPVEVQAKVRLNPASQREQGFYQAIVTVREKR